MLRPQINVIRIFACLIALVIVCNSYIFITNTINIQDNHQEKIEILSGHQQREPHSFIGVNYRKKQHIRYILQWTPATTAPFDFMGEGQSSFIKNNCSHTNCYVTNDRTFLASIDNFDAIVFNGRDVINYGMQELPQSRDKKQKYIFGAMESSHNYPVCNYFPEDYFNWTWTYRLDSDIRWGYITIYDLNGKVVGPAEFMKWPILEPVTDQIKTRLSKKSKAAAWFVSNCNSRSGREKYIKTIQIQLEKYGWRVDIYGSCGEYSCPRIDFQKCFKMLENDYYFYFAFENSFAKDYVTEKLLNALNNFVVPVVFGSANYSRFLPPGSYLNALELGPELLASTMNEVINNKTKYYDYFRWRNHFVYKETSDNEDICKLCEAMNDVEKMKNFSVNRKFKEWWNSEVVSC